MAFEYYEIVPVALMIPEEQVLAVCRVDLLPIFQSHFDGRKWRMRVVFIFYAVFFEEGKNLFNPFVHDFCKISNMFLTDAKVRRKISIFARYE
jgi:hypothetical protein